MHKESDYYYNSVLTPDSIDSIKTDLSPHKAMLCIQPVIQAVFLAGMRCSFTSFIRWPAEEMALITCSNTGKHPAAALPDKKARPPHRRGSSTHATQQPRRGFLRIVTIAASN